MTSLEFRGPSRAWLERLPLGNGRLGVMVGADERGVRLGLNESSVWSGGRGSAECGPASPAGAAAALAEARRQFDGGDPIAAEESLRPLQHRYTQSFLPVGELVVELLSAPAEATVERSLSLADAVCTTRHSWAACVVSSQTAVPRHADTVVHHCTVDGGPAGFRISFASPLRELSATAHAAGIARVLRAPADVAPTHEPAEPARRWEVQGIDPVTAAVEIHLEHDGRAAVDGSAVTILDATRLRVTAAVETTFTGIGKATGVPADAADRARRRVEEHARAELSDHVETSRRRHGAATVATSASTPAVDVAAQLREPDPRVMVPLLFELGRYLLRSSSRSGGLPANLQGLWNAEMRPPWSSNYTLNINTPMNYWGAEPAGETDAHLALLELLEGLADRGRDTARRLYGARGWVAHHNTDAWAYSLPTRGDAAWSIWPFGGAWLVRQFDEHRRFGSMSADVLRRFWPVARGAAEFFCDFVDDDGHTFPSTSPENTYRHRRGAAALTRSSALDRALLTELFETVEQLATASETLDDPVVRRCLEIRARIAPPRSGADGTIVEWDRELPPVDAQHRHLSHLYPWFPGNSGPDSGLEAVARTLDARGDDSTGWSLVWKLALAARLRDVARIERLLPLMLRPADESSAHRGGLYPNLFTAHPPYQIDANLGFVGAVTEMLIQSHRPGLIELLPALPQALWTGRATGLVARPGIIVDLSWSDGALERAAFTARTPAAAGVRNIIAGEHRATVEVPYGATLALDAALVETHHRQEYS